MLGLVTHPAEFSPDSVSEPPLDEAIRSKWSPGLAAAGRASDTVKAERGAGEQEISALALPAFIEVVRVTLLLPAKQPAGKLNTATSPVTTPPPVPMFAV